LANGVTPITARRDALLVITREAIANNLDSLPLLLKLIPKPDEQEMILGEVASVWAKRDAEYLFAYSAANLTGTLRNSFEDAAVRSAIYAKEFDRAQKMLDKMPFSSARLNVMQSIGTGLFQKSPSEAIQWAGSLDLTEDRNRVCASLLTLAESKNRADLLEKMMAMCGAGPVHDEALQSLIRVKIAQEGDAAVLEWAKTQERGERDVALAAYLASASIEDPSALIRILPSIEDAAKRTKGLFSIFGRMTEQNPLAAASAAACIARAN